MDRALLLLLEDKDLEFITVKEICKTAGVNRSTFYLHYETIDDLVQESLTYMDKRFSEYFPVEKRSLAEDLHRTPTEELYLVTPEYLIPYLEYVRDHKSLYRAGVSRNLSLRGSRWASNFSDAIFDPIFKRFSVPKDNRDYLIAYYIEGISAIVKVWLNKDCQDSPETVADIICKQVPSPRERA